MTFPAIVMVELATSQKIDYSKDVKLKQRVMTCHKFCINTECNACSWLKINLERGDNMYWCIPVIKTIIVKDLGMIVSSTRSCSRVGR